MELSVFESPGIGWDEFASRYTDLIFYQSLWSEVLRRGLGGQPLYFCLREGEEIVAGLPGVLFDLKVLRILYASIPYGSLIGEKSFFPFFMELSEREFKKRGIDQVRMTESPFFESLQPPSFHSLVSKCTLLDLRRFEEGKIWESYRSEVRRAIRKAQKNGLSLKRGTSREEAKAFYQLYLSSMKRNRTAAKYPLQWFLALHEIIMKERKGDFLFAMKGDRYAAGVVVIYSSTSIHYLHNGSDEAYLEDRPNDLIVDQLIQNGVKEKKATLDFMGSDPADVSLLRFKEKWGSRSSDLHTYVKDLNPIRCRIWETGKKMASSRVGNLLLRMVRKDRD